MQILKKNVWFLFLVYSSFFCIPEEKLKECNFPKKKYLFAGVVPFRVAALGDVIASFLDQIIGVNESQPQNSNESQVLNQSIQEISPEVEILAENEPAVFGVSSPIVTNLLVSTPIRIKGNVVFSGQGGVTLGVSSVDSAIFKGSSGYGTIDLGNQDRTFTINSAASGVYVETYGAISNGSITKNGVGVLQFAGTNSYTGGTTLSQGEIQVIGLGSMTPTGSLAMSAGTLFDMSSATNNQTIGAFSGDGTVTLGAKTLTFGDASNTSFNGVFQGTGLAEKAGSGMLTLTSSSNVFTNSGPGYALKITQGSVLGNVVNLNSNIELNGGSVVFSQSSDGTYSQTITNTGSNGSLVKTGSAMLELPSESTNTVKGSVDIQQGHLKVNGTLNGGGTLTLGSGCLLTGVGVITQDCSFYGTIEPGNSIGTLVLSGDQSFKNGSRTVMEFTPTNADEIINSGNIIIEDGAILTLVPERTYYDPFRANYDIITTSSGNISGAKFNVENPYPLFFLVGVVYTPQTIQIDVQCITFTTYLQGKNNQAVGQCLGVQNPPSGSDFDNVLVGLRSFPTAQGLNFAVNQLQPSLFTTLAIDVQNSNWIYNNAIRCRMDAVEQGCLVSDRFHAWVSPMGGFTNQKFFSASPNYSQENLGVAFGVDTVAFPYCIFGVSGGYNYSIMKWSEDRGRAHIQDVYAAVYAGLHTDHFAFDVIANGSYNYFDTSRHVKYSNYLYAENRVAHGTHLGWQGSGQAQIAGFFEWGTVVFSPYAQSNYFYMTENAFTERSANSMNLRIKEHTSDLWMYEGGLKMSKCFVFQTKKFSPYVLFGEMREMRFKGAYYTASLNDTNCWFTVKGSYPSRNLFHTRAGLELFLDSIKTSFSFSYDARMNSAVFDQSMYVSGQYDF